MSYLKDFLAQINQRDFKKFLVLWEEYGASDTVETGEFRQLLKAIKASELARPFGRIVETALPLWGTIQDPQESYEILSLLIDLQTTNSPLLADITFDALQKRHGQDPKFNERLRLTGLRQRDQFQGGLAKYDLVAHLAKNNIVFHTGGWGTGEIIDVSFIREHLLIEFENVGGRKDLSFTNAFKTLVPLLKSHFLARRFADPDHLEKEGKEDPVALVKLLLRDLGPKTAAEIKEELCELVIPEKEWTKWWQGARAKVKKDPLIETPESIKDPFYLRQAELSPEERLLQAMKTKTEGSEIIRATYNFVRDTAAVLKDKETKETLQTKLLDLVENKQTPEDQKLQVYLLLEQFFGEEKATEQIAEWMKDQMSAHLEKVIEAMEIVAFKKQALVAIKEYRSDWMALFFNLLFTLSQTQLKDYLLKELNQKESRSLLEKKLWELMEDPIRTPEAFIWYFQKIATHEDASLPFSNSEGVGRFFESFFLLFYLLENRPDSRELLKKMYGMLSSHRYALVRQLLLGTTLEFAKEILLLASKCQTLTDHDMKILRSLAEVVHPSLVTAKSGKFASKGEDDVIWTTEEGYLKIQEKIRQIGTVEVVENAREIEAARALGDLRENSEFKFAQERRARLQSELKTLSSQLNRARILSPDDVHQEEIGVGSEVEIRDKQGNFSRYSILGPWDADPEKNILSFNSKFAQAMIGKKKGEIFHFREEPFEVIELGSYFKKVEQKS